MDKMFGLGLVNIVGLFLLFCALIIGLKIIMTKHPVKGVTEMVNAI